MSDQRILDKLEQMDQRLDNIDITLVRQEGQLAEHMRRSLLNEEAVQLLKTQIEPVKDHVKSVNAVLKFAGGIAICLAAFESIKNLFS
jgi:hypothetical protein